MLQYGNNIFFLICNADNIFKGFQVFTVVVHMMVSLLKGGGRLYVSYFSIFLNQIQSP